MTEIPTAVPDGGPATKPTTLTDWFALTPDDRVRQLEASQDRAAGAAGSHGVYIARLTPEPGSTGGGELAGVPFAVKDNIDVAGVPTTAGGPLLADHVAEEDAGVVAVLREAGALVVGKTNMHELAFGVSSNNAAYGPVRNPHDPTRVAGGSSGGSAAAVALGSVPFSLGTDTGGSVTVPSAFCGVVGFRPSTGRYPGDGVVNLSTTRDTVGLHTHSVRDARLLDGIITRCPPAPDRAVASLRLGVARRRFDDAAPEVEAVVEAALGRLADAGAELVEVEVPGDIETAEAAGLSIVFYETERLLLARAAATGRHPVDLTFAQVADLVASPDVQDLVRAIADRAVSPGEYGGFRAERAGLRRRYAAAFADSGVDALVFPTSHVLTPRLGEDLTVVHNGRRVPTFGTVIRNAGPGSVAGTPMISLPAGTTDGRLPVGLCLEGPFFEDAALLAVAAAAETAVGVPGAGT